MRLAAYRRLFHIVFYSLLFIVAISPSKTKSLIIPGLEPEKLDLELDLSALNSLTLPAAPHQNTLGFIESEDED